MTMGNVGGAKGFWLYLSDESHALDHSHHFADEATGGTILTNIDVNLHIVI